MIGADRHQLERRSPPSSSASRRRSGSPAMGMIMTLVIVADEADADEALSAARSASREHPARILVVVFGDKRGAGQVDAQVGIGSGRLRRAGRAAALRRGHPARRVRRAPAAAARLPVVVWWPGRAPRGPRGRPARPARHPPDHRRWPRCRPCGTASPNTDGHAVSLLASALTRPGPGGSGSAPSADLLAGW